MDTSTLLVVFLLVMVATLASYALSHWSSTRGSLGAGWAATSIGTTLLLTAAAIVILTFVFRGPLWRPNLGTEQQMREAAAVEELSRRIAASPFGPSESTSTSHPSTNQAARLDADRSDIEASPAPVVSKQAAQSSVATPSTSGRSWQPAPAKGETLWGAARCVYVFNPDPSQPARWKVDNGCDTPVVVLLAGRSIVLPAPGQRPVTLDEQTAGSGDYTACFVVTADAIAVIGAPSEERATPQWRAQFESVLAHDACLLTR